jgi:hypothetical protein
VDFDESSLGVSFRHKCKSEITKMMNMKTTWRTSTPSAPLLLGSDTWILLMSLCDEVLWGRSWEKREDKVEKATALCFAGKEQCNSESSPPHFIF